MGAIRKEFQEQVEIVFLIKVEQHKHHRLYNDYRHQEGSEVSTIKMLTSGNPSSPLNNARKHFISVYPKRSRRSQFTVLLPANIF